MKTLASLRLFGLIGSLTVITFAGLAGGCETAKEHGINYEMGTLSAKVPSSFSSVVGATKSALADYGVDIKNSDTDADEAVYEGESKSGKPVTVHLNKLSDSQTEVKVSTDIFGNQQESLALLKKIYNNLNLQMP